MDFMIFDKRNRRFGMMFIFALLLSSIEYTYGQVSLSGCANPVVYSSCDLTCQTPHQNADAVKYFKPPNLSSVIAQCADDGTCAAVGGYTIQRSTSTTTVITILNYTCTDSVTWRCDYDGKFATHDSPCVDFPQTATTTDMSDNSVVNSSVVITVDLGCLVSQGTVQMKFDYKNSGGTIVDSSALSTCSNVSTCTDPLYSTYECQVNLQKESNVLCETKYSIEANVKIADADRTESIHLLNDVEFTCTTPTTTPPTTTTTSTTSTTPQQKCFPYIESESCVITHIVISVIGVLIGIGLIFAIRSLVKWIRNKRDAHEGERSDDDKGKKTNNTNNQETIVKYSDTKKSVELTETREEKSVF